MKRNITDLSIASLHGKWHPDINQTGLVTEHFIVATDRNNPTPVAAKHGVLVGSFYYSGVHFTEVYRTGP